MMQKYSTSQIDRQSIRLIHHNLEPLMVEIPAEFIWHLQMKVLIINS